MGIRPAIMYIKENYKHKLIGAEIGVQKGEHASSILRELDIKKLYLIDIWSSYKLLNHTKEIIVNKSLDYKNVLKKFENIKEVEIIKDSSLNVAKKFKDNYLDFVYIDANHNYEDVLKDIKAWNTKVKMGGIVSGHDYNTWKGVTKAVNEWSKDNNIKLETLGYDWWYRRMK